jgi:hypothetical protein
MHNLQWLQQIGNCTKCSAPITKNLIDGSSLCSSCDDKDSPEHLRHDVKMGILSLMAVVKILQSLEAHVEKLTASPPSPPPDTTA